ncbi:hypothetical protein B7486_07745 [cyanobacterium TDX16]|nr:hypothetical protein B7486_07745 [cyanobacterium TDX16]
MARILVEFGRGLRAARKAKGLTQEELAHRAGVHINYVGRLERGLENPSLKAIAQLAIALGITPATLVPKGRFTKSDLQR